MFLLCLVFGISESGWYLLNVFYAVLAVYVAVFSQILNLVLCVLPSGTVVFGCGAAENRMECTESFCTVNVTGLVGNILPGKASVHYLCALPVPLSEKV